MGNPSAATRTRALGVVLLCLLAVARSAVGWPLVEERCAEIVALLPWHVGAAIELGNARLRLGDAAGARRAYQGLLDAKQRSVEARTRAQVEAQIGRIDSGLPADRITSLRNPWLE